MTADVFDLALQRKKNRPELGETELIICHKNTSFPGHDSTGAGENATQRGDVMKHGKAPTVEQKKLMQKHRLNPENWLVVKNQPDRLVIVSRWNDKTMRVIQR